MPLRRLQQPIDGPFTPVSPSNLAPLTSRFQQISLSELAFINEHLSHNNKSGRNTPLVPTATRTATGSASGTPVDGYFSIPTAFDEEDDKRAEIRADAERPFPVDRELLKDIILQHMLLPVVRMQFLSSGTFHKAFLVVLEDGRDVVARVARRFMPRLKTESEVATINYLRLHTSVPVPYIYAWDANPYNRLGHEYIIMSKAPGVPLHRVFHRLKEDEMHELLKNLAGLIVELSMHRFSHVGSLYQRERKSSSTNSSRHPDDDPEPSASRLGSAWAWPANMNMVSVVPTAVLASTSGLASTRSSPSVPSSPLPTHTHSSQRSGGACGCGRSSKSPHHCSHSHHSTHPNNPNAEDQKDNNNNNIDFFIGPIVSWPFFGDGRGELDSPTELDRGPWPSDAAYLDACARREIEAVEREGMGVERGHKPHLPPKERLSSSSRAGAGVGMGSRSRSRNGTLVHSLRSGAGVGAGASSSSSQNGARAFGAGIGRHNRDGYIESLGGDGGGRYGDTTDNNTTFSDSESSSLEISSSSSSSSSEETSDSDEEVFYRDYRANLRSSLLVAQHASRVGAVEDDMARFRRFMERELEVVEKELAVDAAAGGGGGQFTLHAHDLSLANIFVDEDEHSKITCIIDWESSTIRPLWHTAHLPTFLLPPPPHAHNATNAATPAANLSTPNPAAATATATAHHTPTPTGTHGHHWSTHTLNPELGDIFRRHVRDAGSGFGFGSGLESGFGLGYPVQAGGFGSAAMMSYPRTMNPGAQEAGKLWLTAEHYGHGARRFLEWDGWEEGLLDGVLGKDRLDADAAAAERERVEREAASRKAAVSASASSNRDGRGNGTFKMRNGFIGLSLT